MIGDRMSFKKFLSYVEPILKLFRQVVGILRYIFVTLLLQKVLAPIALVLVYIFGVGLTSLLYRLTGWDKASSKTISKDSYWVKAVGYDTTIEDGIHQS